MRNACQRTRPFNLNSRTALVVLVALVLGVICLTLPPVAADEAETTNSGNVQSGQQPPPKPLDMIKLEASFDEKLFPIFEEQCADCHDAGEAERELQLLEFSTFLAGSIDGPILEPGKAKKSKLFLVLQKGSDPHMPPDGQLSNEDLSAIESWINGLPPALKANRDGKTARRLISIEPHQTTMIACHGDGRFDGGTMSKDKDSANTCALVS